MTRPDGRSNDELRPVEWELGYQESYKDYYDDGDTPEETLEIEVEFMSEDRALDS